MQTCNPSCLSEDIPNTDWAKGCDITTRKGGIPFLTFYRCDPSLSFPYSGTLSPWDNLLNVEWALCNGHLYITGEVLGQKPKGSFTKRRIASCSPEMTVAGQKTITFQDFNSDPTGLLDFDFWRSIDSSKKFLQVGWLTCEDLWFQTTSPWDLEIDHVIEDNKEGMSFYEGAVTINEKEIIKPLYVAGISDLIASFTTADYCY
jgi:hypothetical protein